MHRSMSPAGPLSRAIYDALEDLRVEAVACRSFEGVAVNLAASFEYKLHKNGLDLLATDTATPLANAALLMVRGQLSGRPLPDIASRFLRHWQDEIDTRTGNEIRCELEQMGAAALEQAVFTRWSRRFIESLELVDEPEQGPQAEAVEDVSENDQGEAGFDQAGGEGSQGDSEGQEGPDSNPADAGDDEQDDSANCGDTDPGAGVGGNVVPIAQNKDREPDGQSAPDPMQGTPEESDTADQHASGDMEYHAYTTRFDQIVHARDLAGKDYARQLRAELDREISAHRQVAVRLANRLQNSLTTLQKRAWTFDLDDGLLDTTRLSRLVADPSSPLVYKQERSSQTRDTIVSFLIDNSGSMRGRPITLAAMFADILAQALERCHVATEILGFTTREWRGGQTHQNWRRDGKPDAPGRLSDLRHVIYKAADEPWRRARQSLGVMLWPDLLRENIDGEALLWAHDRLNGRPEQRRILIVISDGVPADDATLTANGSAYLDAHLKRVIEWIETRSPVELLAIGIGHDVDTIYSRSVTIKDSEQLGDAMAHELIELLGNVPTVARYPFAINH
jgi:cobaltochelatase CobT